MNRNLVCRRCLSLFRKRINYLTVVRVFHMISIGIDLCISKINTIFVRICLQYTFVAYFIRNISLILLRHAACTQRSRLHCGSNHSADNLRLNDIDKSRSIRYLMIHSIRSGSRLDPLCIDSCITCNRRRIVKRIRTSSFSIPTVKDIPSLFRNIRDFNTIPVFYRLSVIYCISHGIHELHFMSYAHTLCV